MTLDLSTPATAGYLSGFANEFATEALPGALPHGRNSPQRAPYGLYAEQLSGTAFTAPRGHNRRAGLYRVRPGAGHLPCVRFAGRRAADRAAAGAALHRDRIRPARRRAVRDRGDPARRAFFRRAAGWRRARLHLRELRRAAAPAGSRPDRLERAREPARFPDAAGRIRGPRRRVRAGREAERAPLARGHRP